MVPEGWTKNLLGNVMDFKNGLNFTKNDIGDAIKIVGVADFKDLNELHSTAHLDVVNIADKIRDSELLSDGDLLFVRSNGNKDLIGRCLYFPSVSERLSFSGFTIRGRAKREFVIPEYIAAVARSALMKQQISKNGGGTNISNLSQQILNDIVIPLPRIDEQKKITQVLSIWDKAIAITDKLLCNGIKQKKALMQQLLTGKKRFSGYESDWASIKIGDVLKEVKRPVTWSDDDFYKLLSVKRRSGGVVLREIISGKKILTKKMNLARRGDFIISKMQVLHGATGLVPKEFDGFHISDSYISLISKNSNKLDIEFFSWYSQQKVMYHKSYLCSYGVHIEKMTFNFNMYLKECIYIPPDVKEQKAIVEALNTASREIENIEVQLKNLKQEKTALMQQLLTGKRRVKVDAA